MSYGYPRESSTATTTSCRTLSSRRTASFALSASWDKTLRLWDLNTGTTARRFVGHTSDVLSVSFSADNRQIVSGSRDRTIKLWNTLGECKFNIQEEGHTEWVSCVRFSPNPSNPSSSRLVGTRSSRSGSCPSASSRRTTSVTLATSTPSLSRPTGRCAPRAARTASPCSGSCRTTSTSTRSRPVTASTPSSSRPTATGCARRRPPASRSSTSNPSRSSTSSSPSSLALARTRLTPSACRWRGPPTARRSSLVTRTTRSGSSPSAKQ
ncbi:hypothetical protein L7F22_046372 [Adiantum nelumboides]|nr:hypothetical protein [Adiantum nelumboides]